MFYTSLLLGWEKHERFAAVGEKGGTHRESVGEEDGN